MTEGLYGFQSEEEMIAACPDFARQTHPGKFEGERLYVEKAHSLSLEIPHDEITGGDFYGARVFVPVAPFITPQGAEITDVLCCFIEDSQGFVREISNQVYEDTWLEVMEKALG